MPDLPRRPISLTFALLPILCLAVLGWPAWAADPGPAGRWTVDDVVREEGVAAWRLSPDGALAAWVRSTVATVDGEEKRVSNLWMTRLADARAVALTRGNDRTSSPLFSPDGKRVAFLSTRQVPGGDKEGELGMTQVWAVPVDGGEAFPVTHFDRDVSAFGWIDGSTLVAAAAESPSAWELGRKRAHDTAVVVEDAEHEPPVRLYRVKVDGGEVRRLTENRDWIDSLAVSPDGRWAVVTSQQSLSYGYDERVPPSTSLIDLASGKPTRLFADGALRPVGVSWTPDSAGFYLVNPYSSDPVYRQATVSEVYYYELAGGKTLKVDLGTDRGLGGDLETTKDGFIAILADGVRSRPARFTRAGDGWSRQDIAGTHAANLDGWDLARDGATLAYETSSATTPSQWYAARLDGARIEGERKLTDLNPGYAGKPTGRVEVVHWTGARGDQVEGLLHYPLDWPTAGAGAGPRPLIVAPHGGPAAADHDSWAQRWAYPLLLWRQRGAFVLQVNYHGSADYGLEWVESIGHGHYYELEVPDLETGVDAVIARGLADPGRLASAGWSNGGILTAALITHSGRFRVASIGAADVEWISDWGNVDFGAAFDNYYFGGPPYENPERYIEKSPYFRLKDVTTPTIVYTGSEDRNVPPSQSWSLFRALQQIGRAPVRFVLFPGEPHGLRQVAHQRRKVEEDMAWLDRYLFERPPEALPVVKDGSLLAGLLARAKAARQGEAYGRLVAATLVPETVSFEGLEVGRFEVTRAQIAAFEKGEKPTRGEANLPAAGVPFERAQAYATWLARTTGRPFRLPTEEEAERLAKTAGGSGNTLDRWAGYSPNPEDAGSLGAALASLPGPAPLLLPVGSFPPSGESAVFDLDGNVAEWALAKGGEGVAVGPSADLPADPRSAGKAAPAYVGLRVVVGPLPKP